MRKTSLAAFALAFLAAAAGPAAALDKRYPDWPCRQLKVPQLSVAAIWAGPPIDTSGSALEPPPPELAELVAFLAARRTPLAEADARIAASIQGSESERQEKARKLFTALFETLNTERGQVMNGIERAYRKEKAFAEQIRTNAAKLRELQDSAPANETAVQQLAEQVQWDTRIFEDRRTTMRYACEVPVLIEQRLFALAQAIQKTAQ